MITIGQLAGYAGVTVKAVRHYHERGLLDEPERDSSGYRRYTAEHAIRLVKIKTLADAGVPLARVRELLTATPEQLAAATEEIDRALADRMAEMARSRERIARLRAGDRLFVPADIADYLDELRDLGLSPRGLQLERDGWILLHVIDPELARSSIVEKRELLVDKEFRQILLDHDAAFDWAPDDPRLAGVADRTRRWLAAQPPASEPTVDDPALARLLNGWSSASSPAWKRLARLIGGAPDC